MAREGEGPTNFGAFLDSTLDRLADSAVFLGVLIYFVRFAPADVVAPGAAAAAVCMALGLTVSYARAKAESLGRSAKVGLAERADRDRKSTRLNSSHVAISYAVFCLKKKKRKL